MLRIRRDADADHRECDLKRAKYEWFITKLAAAQLQIAYFTLWNITFRCKLKTHISSAVGESTYTLSSLVSIQFLDSNRNNVSSSGQIIQYQNLNSYELGFQPACLRQMSATTKFPAIM